MSSNPLVSIVIPVFNGANYLASAIESALGQSYPETEVLVIDDGSTDDGATLAVVESFGDRIRYVTKPNGGVATALNTGIEHMRGQLFSWLSHDDLYRPDKVARQVETWRRFGRRCLVIGDFELMDEHGHPLHRISLRGHNLIARPLDSVFRGMINGCALLVPRDLFDEAGLFETGLPTTQDYHLWYRMARLVPFVHCPHADVVQRIHSGQGSRHASHLEEASRMFAHLIDSTPPQVMQAYDGSELRFLLRTREVLTAYPGLQSYLTYRIQTLVQKVRYSIVVWGACPPETVDVARLKRQALPPASIVVLQPGSQSHGDVEAPACTHPAEILRSARNSETASIVLFAHFSRLPSEEQVRVALESMIMADADAARPANAPLTLSELDGLIARRDALPALEKALRETGFGSPESRISPQFTAYPAIDPFIIETPQELTKALVGDARIPYHDRLSEAAVAGLITAQHKQELPTILFIQHSLGGGAQVHMSLLIQALSGRANSVILYGEANRTLRVSLNSERYDAGLVFHCPDDLPALVRIVRRSGIVRVDVHHVISFEKEADLLLDELQLPFDVTLVDYHLVAHSPFLCFGDGQFVGDEGLSHDAAILRRAPPSILRKASRVIAISRDLAERFRRLCADVPILPATLWHDSGARVRHVFPPRLWGNEPLRVVIAGAIAHHKGRDIIIAVAREIAIRNLPVRLHLMGRIHLERDEAADVGSALTVHGPYPEGGFGSTLGGMAPHVAWLPAQVPETWSYVLSHFIDAALPIAASALGAIPERCHGRPFTWLLPWNASADDWVELFLRLHATKLREPARWVNIDHLPPAQPFYFSEYLAPESRRLSSSP